MRLSASPSSLTDKNTSLGVLLCYRLKQDTCHKPLGYLLGRKSKEKKDRGGASIHSTCAV
jgi:hypothetical protein